MPGTELAAVASRSSSDRAQAFAEKFSTPGAAPARAYGTYEELLADERVDVVYIATPHPQHRAVALAALAAGKALLVEKAFTVTPAATREIVDAAATAQRFVMEAMWTRFQPSVLAMRELIADGAIGDVRFVQADLGVLADPDPAGRFFNRELGGGALFDLSVYPISFAQMVLGTPDTVTATGTLTDTGVDLEESISLGYADGRSAVLLTSLRCPMPGQARVFGTGGWIDVLPRFHHPDTIVLHRAGAEPETIVSPPTGGGYAHELAEVTACIEAGALESAVMPLADTVAVQDVMGQVAQQLGMEPVEGPAAL